MVRMRGESSPCLSEDALKTPCKLGHIENTQFSKGNYLVY